MPSSKSRGQSSLIINNFLEFTSFCQFLLPSQALLPMHKLIQDSPGLNSLWPQQWLQPQDHPVLCVLWLPICSPQQTVPACPVDQSPFLGERQGMRSLRWPLTSVLFLSVPSQSPWTRMPLFSHLCDGDPNPSLGSLQNYPVFIETS